MFGVRGCQRKRRAKNSGNAGSWTQLSLCFPRVSVSTSSYDAQRAILVCRQVLRKQGLRRLLSMTGVDRDDIVQTALMRSWKLGRGVVFAAAGDVKRYAYVACHSVLVDHMRKKRRIFVEIPPDLRVMPMLSLFDDAEPYHPVLPADTETTANKFSREQRRTQQHANKPLIREI
jgi:DNA-directed RNA polymerase specialized sigma24 family protein